MSDPKRTEVEMRDFPGLMSDIDDNDIPPGGGIRQINTQHYAKGELRIRHGYRILKFEPIYSG